jgi:hypothetical protein
MPTIHIDGLPEGRTQEEKDSFEEQCIQVLLQTEGLKLERKEIIVFPHEMGEGKKISVFVVGLKIDFDIREDLERPFSLRNTVASLLGAIIRRNFPKAIFEVNIAPRGPDKADS